MQKGRYKVDRNMLLNDGCLMLSVGDQFYITNLLENDRVSVSFHDHSFIVDHGVLSIGSTVLDLTLKMTKFSD